MLGNDVIVIDPENEYKYLAETVGGTIFNISIASPYHINPFDLPLPRPDEGPPDRRDAIRDALTGGGARVLDFRIERHGLARG